jgi:hypothetical protein
LDELERFNSAYRALPITEALPIEALPVDTSKSALPVDTDINELAIPVGTDEPVETNEPVETDEPAVLFANITEPLMEGTFTLETDEPSVEEAFTLEIDERAEPSVEDAPTFNTLTSSLSTTTLISSQSIPLTNGCLAYTLTLPPLPLSSIPATGFGQLHILQYTDSSAISTFAEFGRFQALQRTGVG